MKKSGENSKRLSNSAPVESVDKGISVNTLFDDENNHDFKIITESSCMTQTKVRSSKISPKVKRLKNKIKDHQRNTSYGVRLKDIARIQSPGKQPTSKMGVAKKKIRQKNESKPEMEELEQSREVEEIIVDQGFKVLKENLPVLKKDDGGGEPAVTKRPISGSSSSGNTVLQNDENKYKSQVVQTNGFEMESVGVQAFSSRKSTIRKDSKSITRVEEEEEKKKRKAEHSNGGHSSKNIQAFGINSSLPRELAHPKERINIRESQNEKSTQYFGGPINSLPNYHSPLQIKPIETCGRDFIQKRKMGSKKMASPESTDSNGKREKDKMVKNGKKSIVVGADDCKENIRSVENKENVAMVERKAENSTKQKNLSGSELTKTSQISTKNQIGSDSEFYVKSKNRKNTETSSTGSDRILSLKSLTSEILKEHYYDSIDKNLIQEKYFQSQLVEIEKRKEMISKTTSDDDDDKKKKKISVTVGCQYSLPSSSRDDDGDGKNNEEEGKSHDTSSSSEGERV